MRMVLRAGIMLCMALAARAWSYPWHWLSWEAFPAGSNQHPKVFVQPNAPGIVAVRLTENPPRTYVLTGCLDPDETDGEHVLSYEADAANPTQWTEFTIHIEDDGEFRGHNTELQVAERQFNNEVQRLGQRQRRNCPAICDGRKAVASNEYVAAKGRGKAPLCITGQNVLR